MTAPERPRTPVGQGRDTVPATAQVLIIGAGPAGMAAAAEATRSSSHVVLVDAGPLTGGQYWRHRPADEAPDAPAPRWHHGWSTYRDLLSQLRSAQDAGRLQHLPSRHVTALDRRADGHWNVLTSATPESTREQRLETIVAETVVLCPGAYDRQLPVPGWTLPGVMAAGGIQAFIKVHERVPGRRVLLAGTGPFLLAAAASILQAGGEVAAICESADLTGWAPRGATAALVPSKGVEGAQYAALLARHRVPYLRRTVITDMIGTDRVEAVVTARCDQAGRPVAGTERQWAGIDLVGTGWGFTPQAELLVQAGAGTRMDVDDSLVGVVDADQASTVPGLFLAGEITGVTGAIGAVAEGRIAGRAAAARATGAADPEAGKRRAWVDAAARARHRAFAAAMHHAHPIPSGWSDLLEDDTVVCRCEEVTSGEVRRARDELGLFDPRSLKGSTRAGMGMCQGRVCGFAASCLSGEGEAAAAARPDTGRAEEKAEALRAAQAAAKRPFALPMPLGALAEAEEEGASGEGRQTPLDQSSARR